MEPPQPTIRELHLICATATVAMPTARKFFRQCERLRPAMTQRIEAALQALRLEHVRLRSASDIAEAKSLTSHLRARGPAVVPHKL